MTKEQLTRLKTAVSNLSNAASFYKGTKAEHAQLQQDQGFLTTHLDTLQELETATEMPKTKKTSTTQTQVTQ